MLSKISKAISLAAVLALISLPALSDDKNLHTWPPPQVKSNEPRFDLSTPGFNPALGRDNKPTPTFKPHPVDQAYIYNYRAANRLYSAGRQGMTSLPYKPGHRTGAPYRDPRLQQARDSLNHARLQYRQYLTHRDRLEFPRRLKKDPAFSRRVRAWSQGTGALPDWDRRRLEQELQKTFPRPLSVRWAQYPRYNDDYRWRMNQIAAAAKINQGNIQALTTGGSTSTSRRYMEALAMYGALKTGTMKFGAKYLKYDPVPIKVANRDDRRIIAQAHNNLGTAITSRHEFLVAHYMKLDKFPAKFENHKLIVKDADLKRWLNTKTGRAYLDSFKKGLDNFRAALRYQPDNKLYFFNLYNALMSLSRRYFHLVDPKKFEACARLLVEMEKVLRNPTSRRALVKKIVGSNPCLGPAQDPGDNKKPAAKAAKPPLKPAAKPAPPAKKPPTKCRPRGLTGGLDCVGKRIQRGR